MAVWTGMTAAATPDAANRGSRISARGMFGGCGSAVNGKAGALDPRAVASGCAADLVGECAIRQTLRREVTAADFFRRRRDRPACAPRAARDDSHAPSAAWRRRRRGFSFRPAGIRPRDVFQDRTRHRRIAADMEAGRSRRSGRPAVRGRAATRSAISRHRRPAAAG